MLAAPPTPVPPPVPGDTHTPPPPGMEAIWAPMPQIAGGGYQVFGGAYYRAALSLSGLASTFGSSSNITSTAVGQGFEPGTVQVWKSTSDPGFPHDWTSPPAADAYVQGQYSFMASPKIFPVSQCHKTLFVTDGCGTLVEVWAYDYQPIGAPPPSVTPNQTTATSTSTGGLMGWALGIASLAGLGWYFRKPIAAKLRSIKW